MTNTGFMAITTNADVQLLSQVLPSPDRERERKREREREIERERESNLNCRFLPRMPRKHRSAFIMATTVRALAKAVTCWR